MKKINIFMHCVCVCIVTQLCLTLCSPVNCSLPGSSVHGIFFRLEYWSGLTFLPPGDLPDPGIEPGSPVSPASAGEYFSTEPSEKPVVGIREASSDKQPLRDGVGERFRCIF